MRERGYRFSGGEKQRLSIARLLLKASDIVILDEATAYLDSESEAAIQKACEIALNGQTSIVIAYGVARWEKSYLQLPGNQSHNFAHNLRLRTNAGSTFSPR